MGSGWKSQEVIGKLSLWWGWGKSELLGIQQKYDLRYKM